MSEIISVIFSELFLISDIVPNMVLTLAVLSSEIRRAFCESWLAIPVFSAVCRTVSLNSDMLAAVCSREAACYSVRDDRSSLPADICAEAVLTDWEEALTENSEAATFSTRSLNALAVRPISSLRESSARRVRSRWVLADSMVERMALRFLRIPVIVLTVNKPRIRIAIADPIIMTQNVK